MVSISCYLSTSRDRSVDKCFKLDKLLPARSALTSTRRPATSYSTSLSVPCDLWQCDALPLRCEICKKQKSLLISALLAIALMNATSPMCMNQASVRNKCVL